MNVTLDFIKFFKDFKESLITLDESPSYEQFIGVFICRIISFFIFTLSQFFKIVWIFHTNKKISLYDKISFYFEEILTFLIMPSYFITYYFLRFSFFLFFFFIRLCLIILSTILEYLTFTNEDPLLDDEIYIVLFELIKEASHSIELWYSFKKVKFLRNSFQFLFLWLYYLVFFIIIDTYVQPWIISLILRLLNNVTNIILKTIDLIQKTYNTTTFILLELIYVFFFELNKQQRYIYILKYTRQFIKLIIFYTINLVPLLFIYIMPGFIYIYFLLFKLFLLFFKVFSLLKFFISILLDFFSIYLISVLCSVIVKVLWAFFGWCSYVLLTIIKPVYPIFFIIFANFVNFFYLILELYISTILPRFFVRVITFIILYLYICIIVSFVTFFSKTLDMIMFFQEIKKMVLRFSMFILLIIFNIINLISFIAFSIYISILFFKTFKALFFLEALTFFYICEFFFYVKYLKLKYFIKKSLYIKFN